MTDVAKLEALHELVARELTAAIRDGVVDDQGVRQPASASMFANAVKFLRDNDIQATKDNATVNSLRHALGNLPFNGPPDDTERSH